MFPLWVGVAAADGNPRVQTNATTVVSADTRARSVRLAELAVNVFLFRGTVTRADKDSRTLSNNPAVHE